MIKLAWCSMAALVGGSALCPVCEAPAVGAAAGSQTSSALAAVTASALAAPPAAATDTVRVRLAVSGMTCGGCATTARIALQRVEGVYRAEVSYDSASAVVWYDPARTSPELFIARLRDLTGYEARVQEEPGRPTEAP